MASRLKPEHRFAKHTSLWEDLAPPFPRTRLDLLLVVNKNPKNSCKEVGWQILVSQTLDVHPSVEGGDLKTDEKKNCDLPEYRITLHQVPDNVYMKIRGTERRHYSETEVLGLISAHQAHMFIIY